MDTYEGAEPQHQKQKALPAGTNIANMWLRLAAWFLEGILITLTFGIGWLIWGAFVGPTGRTPAKQLLSLRVIRADNLTPAGLGRMFWVRGILGGLLLWSIVVPITFGIILLMPLWDRNNQNIWDKMSNCVVASDPDDAWDTRGSGLS